MSDNNINRRNFLLKMSLGGTALGVALSTPKIIARTANGFLVESEEEYGGFYVEKLSSGKFPYEFDKTRLKAMREKYTMFSRNMWDPERQDRPSDNLFFIF